MKKHHLKIIVPGIFAAGTLALALGVGARTAPAAAPPQATTSQQDADMKAECQAMMAKKQEMQDKCKAADERLENLVEKMNAAEGSTAVDAMEKPIAAVVNELVAQHKAFHSMMMEMQPEMMKHMMHHIAMQGMEGGMECPMMKAGDAPEPKAEGMKHKM